uniref:Methyltransf_21 domain-containing protein n=1 Tax=Caenorhabditis japonica TaxID=281687 RepID=A0A8R1HUE6_CAEJA
MFTISNYLAFSKISTKIETKLSTSRPNPPAQTIPTKTPISTTNIQDSNEMKNRRRLALSEAENHRKTLLEASKANDNKDFYQKVKLEAYCEKKERIGEVGDGGKYVCNSKAVKKDCTIVSLGLNDQIVFDKDIAEKTERVCKILGADVSEQKPQTKEAYANINGQLFTGRIPYDLTIPDMLKKAGRTEVELLKIDIEGYEFEGLEPLLKEHFVCQIFIEIHGSTSRHLQMLQTIARYGFRIFNVDENLLCPTCCEYSMINEMCMAQFGVVPLGITIPQP